MAAGRGTEGVTAGGGPDEVPASVKSAARVLDLAELLAGQRGGASFTDIRRALGIPASSCHMLLQTLLARGYLVKEERAGTYRLSRKWAQLALDYEDVDLAEQAGPVMESIWQLCGESISLAVMDHDEMLIIHKKTSRGRIRIVNPVGTRLPVHGSALGKAILASWPAPKLDAWLRGRTLAAYTPATITSPDALRRCLDEVRLAGVAYDRQESAPEILAAGAAILGEANEAVAALSIQALPGYPAAGETGDGQGLAGRPRPGEGDPALDGEHWDRLARLVRAGANTISIAMGYTGPAGPCGLECLGGSGEEIEAEADPGPGPIGLAAGRWSACEAVHSGGRLWF